MRNISVRQSVFFLKMLVLLSSNSAAFVSIRIPRSRTSQPSIHHQNTATILQFDTSFPNSNRGTKILASRLDDTADAHSFGSVVPTDDNTFTFSPSPPPDTVLFPGPKKNSDHEEVHNSETRRILNGALVAPAMLTAPLYGIGFGLFGYKPMWAFSEWIYKMTKPSEGYLHDHFGRMQKYLATKRSAAIQKSRSYRIHPTFAGISLITTALLAFGQDMFPKTIATSYGGGVLGYRGDILHLSYKQFRAFNILTCFVSAIAAIPLENTMLGNKSAKRWNGIQGNLSMLFAALTACPASLGRLMVHLNWSIIFCGGFLERFYVLCVLSQLDVSDRKKYIGLYSPQIKIATLGSIPIGILTFFMFR